MVLGIAGSVLHPSRPSFGTLVFWYFRVDLGTFWYFLVTFGYIWVLFGTFPFPFNQEVQVGPFKTQIGQWCSWQQVDFGHILQVDPVLIFWDL